MKNLFAPILIAITLVAWPLYAGHEEKEHAGQEHAGEEHAGKEVKKKDEGKKQDANEVKKKGEKEEEKKEGKPESRIFSPDQIKQAMTAHIEKTTEQNGGVFKFVDPDRSGQQLTLKFVKIHDPVRKLSDGGYFACTDFQVSGGPNGQLLDLDFWLKPAPDGSLQVTQTKVHKDAVLVDGRWEKKARYTFIDDKPVALGITQ